MTLRVSGSPVSTAECPVRGAGEPSTVFRVSTESDYVIARCAACELAYAIPGPTAAELNEFYTSTYFKKSSKDDLGYGDYRTLAEANARRAWRALESYIDLAPIRPRRLLDLGCATGGFLAEAQAKGWTCEGVELSEDAVAVARREFGLNVIRGDIHGLKVPAGTYGLVTMWHVLEHLIEPMEAMRRASDLLAPGGYLFVELPNWDSLGRRVRQSSWGALTPPEHINFFNARSIGGAARNAGLDVIRCTTHYPSVLDKAAVARPSRPLHLAVAGLAVAVSRFGFGGYLRLLARKPLRVPK